MTVQTNINKTCNAGKSNIEARLCQHCSNGKAICIIQGDQNVSVHLMIIIQKVTSYFKNVPRQSPDSLAADRQGQGALDSH
jgi:hypothetical protein